MIIKLYKTHHRTLIRTSRLVTLLFVNKCIIFSDCGHFVSKQIALQTNDDGCRKCCSLTSHLNRSAIWNPVSQVGMFHACKVTIPLRTAGFSLWTRLYVPLTAEVTRLSCQGHRLSCPPLQLTKQSELSFYRLFLPSAWTQIYRWGEKQGSDLDRTKELVHAVREARTGVETFTLFFKNSNSFVKFITKLPFDNV